MESFVIKYANFRIDEIWNSSAAQGEKNTAINQISETVIDYKCGYISVNDAMRIISNIETN